MITPIAGKMDTPAGSATQPYFGIDPVLCDTQGNVLEGKASGALCLRDSWPGQARSIWGDHARFIETYFSAFPGFYFSGDAANRDEQGNYWIEGRMDDVINMAGHRLGTAEIEAAINEHPQIAESAVVGVADTLKKRVIGAGVRDGLHNARSNGPQCQRCRLGLWRQHLGQVQRKQIGFSWYASWESWHIERGKNHSTL